MKLSDLSELFEQAIAIENEAARAEFVATSCPDEASRLKLTDLVSAHQQTGCLVDEPEAAIRIARELHNESAGSYDESPVREGQRLGNYKLLQRIGEGGMGYVFMADQVEPIQRRVAIKVIKTSNNSRQVLTRFEAERSALARLDHNNITRILDAGVTESGSPFFVMELVRGDSLTEYCDRHKLPIRDRVELLEQICLAVHHAHQKGIIHRDIKPANIMVTLHDGEPVPKVIDFGIAKALDRPLVEGTLFTRYGDMVGTPQYMSPEQAEKSGLDLDVRTDIYSLGAVLFELLTGTPPIEPESLEGKGVLGVLETVRDNDTESPSTRATRFMALDDTVASQRATDQQHLPRLLRGELDWIALKALARDRTLRYESAAAMARDLRSYLDGGTVDAAAPSFIYQSRKLFQRHRTIGLAVAACAALMLAITLVSFGWAVSNNRLKQVATDRADELGKKTKRLEELNGELRVAIDRAQTAEQEALLLANEKKEQAALDRATRRHLTQVVTSSLPDTMEFSAWINGGANGPQPLEIMLDQRSFAARRNKDTGNKTPTVISITSEVSAKVRNGKTTIVLPDGSFAGNESTITSTTPIIGATGFVQQLFPTHDPLNSGLGPQNRSPHPSQTMFNTAIPKPNQMGSLLVEEYRNEFGDHHPKVAQALVYTCRIGLENKRLAPEILESRLREALVILGDSADRENISTRITAKTLLAEALHQAGRTSDAKQHLAAARDEVDKTKLQLENETAASLSRELKRVESLLSAKKTE